jgi:hypothetical protein
VILVAPTRSRLIYTLSLLSFRFILMLSRYCRSTSLSLPFSNRVKLSSLYITTRAATMSDLNSSNTGKTTIEHQNGLPQCQRYMSSTTTTITGASDQIVSSVQSLAGVHFISIDQLRYVTKCISLSVCVFVFIATGFFAL